MRDNRNKFNIIFLLIIWGIFGVLMITFETISFLAGVLMWVTLMLQLIIRLMDEVNKS